jgi:hypothetical protein
MSIRKKRVQTHPLLLWTEKISHDMMKKSDHPAAKGYCMGEKDHRKERGYDGSGDRDPVLGAE